MEFISEIIVIYIQGLSSVVIDVFLMIYIWAYEWKAAERAPNLSISCTKTVASRYSRIIFLLYIAVFGKNDPLRYIIGKVEHYKSHSHNK